jgi:hypothetical protein
MLPEAKFSVLASNGYLGDAKHPCLSTGTLVLKNLTNGTVASPWSHVKDLNPMAKDEHNRNFNLMNGTPENMWSRKFQSKGNSQGQKPCHRGQAVSWDPEFG